MPFPDNYMAVLKGGVSLETLGVKEVALKREEAITAIHTLDGTNVAVLGGDVLNSNSGRIQYTGENWYSERSPTESVQDFLYRSRHEAEEYIKNYPGSEDVVLFVLVASAIGGS